MKKRMLGAVSLLGLAGAYLMLRYPLFFLHHMIEWPFDLFAVGAVIIVISGLVLGQKVLPVLTLAGYIVGSVLGYIFQFDYGDYSRGLNSLWIIWTFVYLGAILVGVAAEFFCRKRKTI